MTTSTNEVEVQSKKGGSFTKAASATLAGVLAVGMVPAVAFAEAAEDVQEDEGISALMLDPADNFNEGKITSIATWSGIDGSAPTITDNKVTVTPGSSVVGITIDLASVTATLGDGTTISNLAWTNGTIGTFKLSYYKGTSATGTALSAINGLGDYCIAITATSGDYKGAQIVLPVQVKGIDISSGATVTLKDDENQTFNTTQVYSGKEFSIVPTVEVGGDTLVAGVDYTTKVVAGGTTPTSPAVTPKNAGKYIYVVTGIGKYTGNKTTSFEIKAFDLKGLTSANFVTSPVINSSSMPTVANILSITDAASNVLQPTSSDIQITLDEGEIWDANDLYPFNVTPASGQTNVVNTATPGTAAPQAEIAKVGAAAVYKYDGEDMPSSITIDTTKTAKSGDFEVDNVAVYKDAKAFADDSAYTADTEYTITVSKDGGAFGALSANQGTGKSWFEQAKAGNIPAGNYVVRVTIDPSQVSPTYSVGGYQDINIVVTNGSINATANASISYDDVAFTSLNLPFDPRGYNFGNTSSRVFKPAAKLTNGTSADSTKMKIEVTDASGKKVPGDTITAVGTYTLKVTSTAYNITGNDTATVTIDKFNLTDLSLDVTGAVKKNNGNVYVDTASDDVELSDLNILTSYVKTSDPLTYKSLGADFAAVDAMLTKTLQKKNSDGEWEAAAQIDQNDNGVAYRLVIAPVNSNIEANATFATEEGTIIDIQTSKGAWLFGDVAPSSWYFGAVANAVNGGSNPTTDPFMSGYSSTLFGPNDSMTRAQAVAILYNMSGGTISGLPGEETPSDDPTFKSFDDVAPNAWYAEAVAWGKATGIANGFGGTNNFGPEQQVSREQFAAFLWNYAKEIGSATTNDITDAAMNKLADAGAVSGWAKGAVSWAVQNQIMGNGGSINPNAIVSRAEAAGMGVNFLQKNNA